MSRTPWLLGESEHRSTWDSYRRVSAVFSVRGFHNIISNVAEGNQMYWANFPKPLWWRDKMLIEQQHPLILSIGFPGILAKMYGFVNGQIIV